MKTIDIECHSKLGLHKMACHIWGNRGCGIPIVCVHGVTSNGLMDFGRIAKELSKNRRVYCLDLVGRGESDWLSDSSVYGLPQYLADMNAFLDHIGAKQVDWIGTSLGGLIGMVLAAQRKIRMLIVNDTGIYVPQSTVELISGLFPEEAPIFTNLKEAESYMRKMLEPITGPLGGADWRHMAKYGTQDLATLSDQKIAKLDLNILAKYSTPESRKGLRMLNYDPGIGAKFKTPETRFPPFDNTYRQIRCPTLLLHGEDSMFLSNGAINEMKRSGPHPVVLTFPGGHPLMLTDQAVKESVFDFLGINSPERHFKTPPRRDKFPQP
jgi:pimeloyl-ACP methyl ester carboxylesterase